MQIVIDIEEERYNQIKRCADNYLVSGLELAIKNGKPLPKGHGDLIDRQELLKSTLCKTFGLRSVDIENAPTIIEADRSEEG